jgi:kynurenine formamidase
MELTTTINGDSYKVILDKAQSIAIELDFEGPQPNHFGVAAATAKTYQAGSFVGDTRRGGSCNCDEIKLVPHCVGTHTESIGHVTDDHKPLIECPVETLTAATLITINPISAAEDNAGNSYQPELEAADRFISKQQIETLLGTLADNQQNEFLTTLIIRTLPNPLAKQFNQYGAECQPPFFSNQAMEFISGLPVKNIIVDFPSIDRMNDDGILSNHRLFWEIIPAGKTVTNNSNVQRTVTEMAYINDSLPDGKYLINIQFPAWKTDAIPSKPSLYPLQKL